MNYFSILTIAWSFFVGVPAHATPLSLREKIGQMLIIGFEESHINAQSPIVKIIEEDNIGGVILFDSDRTKQSDKNIESPDQVRQLNAYLQSANQQAQQQRHQKPLPLLISVDYEGGARGTRLNPSRGFPQTFSAATVSQMDDDQIKVIANGMAGTLKDVGFNLNFAPIVDVNVNPDCPIIGKLGRSFSADPNVVAHDAKIYSQAYLNRKIQCAYKHFPGHGSATGDSHLGFVDVTDTWQPKELEPYVQLLGQDESCNMVMTAHLVNRQLDESGLPATLSHKILTDLLRNKLHFNGVIVTDDMQMKAISDNYSLEQALTLAINAGADMVIFGNQLTDKPQDPKEIINIIEAKVHSGEISQQRIDDAYQHIQTMKEMIQ